MINVGTGIIIYDVRKSSPEIEGTVVKIYKRFNETILLLNSGYEICIEADLE